MDRGAWQAVVYGVAKESDMTETKQKQSITSSQSLFRHVHQDSNSNSGNQSSSTKSDSWMLKLLLFLRGDGLQSQCILSLSKVIWVHWTQSVSPKVLLEQLDSIISYSFFFFYSIIFASSAFQTCLTIIYYKNVFHMTPLSNRLLRCFSVPLCIQIFHNSPKYLLIPFLSSYILLNSLKSGFYLL